MKRKQFAKILSYIGVIIFSFGLGWFVRDKIEQVSLPLYSALLIVFGLILLIFSFYPRKK